MDLKTVKTWWRRPPTKMSLYYVCASKTVMLIVVAMFECKLLLPRHVATAGTDRHQHGPEGWQTWWCRLPTQETALVSASDQCI